MIPWRVMGRAALLLALLAGCEKKAPLLRCTTQADCPVRQICLERRCVDPKAVGIQATKPVAEEGAAPAAPAPTTRAENRRVVDDSGPAVSRTRPKSFGENVEKSLERWDNRVRQSGSPLH